MGDVREEDVGRVSGLTVTLARPLIGCKEIIGKTVFEEGVTEAALINHENRVGEADTAVVVVIVLVLGVLVDWGEEVAGPLGWERGQVTRRSVG